MAQEGMPKIEQPGGFPAIDPSLVFGKPIRTGVIVPVIPLVQVPSIPLLHHGKPLAGLGVVQFPVPQPFGSPEAGAIG